MSTDIKKVSFRLLTEEVLNKMSHVEVSTPTLPILSSRASQQGSPLDLRLGSDQNDVYCETCKKRGGECIGHQGLLELAAPIVHPGMRHLFKGFLKKLCLSCCRLSINPLSKGRCSLCGQVSRYQFLTHYSVLLNGEPMKTYNLYQSFKNIPAEDYTKVPGFKHNTPLVLFLTKMVIPSITIRPSIGYRGVKALDDLTKKVDTIVQVNQKLKKLFKAQYLQKVKLEVYNLLSYQISTYFDNKISGLPVSTDLAGKTTKSLVQILESKQGLLRSNLRGKRTQYSSRCVITADSTLEVDQVGIPLRIAKILSKPVIVTSYNIEQVRTWLKSTEYVSASYYMYKNENGNYVRVRVLDSNRDILLERLKPGDVVHRDLVTGDYVGFNRQPTIHRYGFMGHKIVVYEEKEQEGLTFRINPSACLPYNADFDGDEMTIHVPQTEGAELDLKLFMYVKNNSIDTKSKSPAIGITKELLTAAYCLSLKDQTFKRDIAIGLLGSYYQLDDKQEYTNKDLISMCLPGDFSFDQGPDPKNILIEKGVFKRGVLTKSNCAPSSEFFKQLALYSGSNFWTTLNKLLTLLRNYYKHTKHSIGFFDYLLDSSVEETLKNLRLKYEKKFEKEEKNKEEDQKVALIKEISHDLQLESYKYIQKSIEETGENPAIVMSRAGSSGSMTSLIQILNLVGSRLVQGEVPKSYFGNMYPTLTGSSIGSRLYEQGLIWGNYKKGLSFLDFLNDSMYSRDATLVNQLKVSTIGYFSRRILSSLGDIYIDKDNYLRDGKDQIIQFELGGNNLDLDEFKPKVVNPVLKQRIAQGFYRPLEPSPDVSDLKAYVKRYHDETYYQIIKANMQPKKKFNQVQVDRIISSMYIPIGFPIGMSTGHAMTEPCFQLTLSSKHNITGQQNSFSRFTDIVDKTLSVPSVVLVAKNEEDFRRLKSLLIPQKVGQLYQLEPHLQQGAILIKNMTKETMDKLTPSILAFDKEVISSVDVEGVRLKHKVLSLKSLGKLYYFVKELIVKGLKEIKDYTIFNKDLKMILFGSKGSFTFYKVLYDLIRLKTLNQEDIEFKNPVYCEQKKGVEVARKVLYQQLVYFLNQGIKIDPRYFSLFCDLVSNKGYLTSSSREGLMKQKPPLMRAAYEATKTVLYQIALTRERDLLKSPISSIIIGKPLTIGVNYPTISF